jgi:hypothetical protein
MKAALHAWVDGHHYFSAVASRHKSHDVTCVTFCPPEARIFAEGRGAGVRTAQDVPLPRAPAAEAVDSG